MSGLKQKQVVCILGRICRADKYWRLLDLSCTKIIFSFCKCGCCLKLRHLQTSSAGRYLSPMQRPTAGFKRSSFYFQTMSSRFASCFSQGLLPLEDQTHALEPSHPWTLHWLWLGAVGKSQPTKLGFTLFSEKSQGLALVSPVIRHLNPTRQ